MTWALGREGTHEVVSETDRHGKPLRTLICMETGLVRNDPVPSDEELARFYADDYRIAYKGAAKPRRRQVVRNFRRVTTYVRMFRDVLDPATHVLDVGAGSGEFAYLMTRLGKTVKGIEPNSRYAAYCRETLGLDVQTVHLSPDLFAPGQFDLISPESRVGAFERSNKVSRSDRLLAHATRAALYEVPNIEAYCREKSRGRMFHYAHIFNFNPWTLAHVRRSGWPDRSTGNRSANIGHHRRILQTRCLGCSVDHDREPTERTTCARNDRGTLRGCVPSGPHGEAIRQTRHAVRGDADRACPRSARCHR